MQELRRKQAQQQREQGAIKKAVLLVVHGQHDANDAYQNAKLYILLSSYHTGLC